MDSQKAYTKFTARLALNIAAPHTWAASIMPVLVAVCLAIAQNHPVSLVMACVLLVISVLMQSSVNALNDYFDFVKGTDSASDDLEENDAVLVYNHINPKAVRNLAILFLIVAFLLGLYVIVMAGLIPLFIALLGALIVFLYSGGKTPISYLPLGEVVSGFVMGCLITFASYYAVTRVLDGMIFVWSLPLFIGIALIMLTNNTCDIEKDWHAKRKTLPALLQRPKAKKLYRVLLLLWYASIVIIIMEWFTYGIILLPFMILIAYPATSALWTQPFDATSRIAAMSQICSLNIILGTFYALSIVCGGFFEHLFLF